VSEPLERLKNELLLHDDEGQFEKDLRWLVESYAALQRENEELRKAFETARKDIDAWAKIVVRLEEENSELRRVNEIFRGIVQAAANLRSYSSDLQEKAEAAISTSEKVREKQGDSNAYF